MGILRKFSSVICKKFWCNDDAVKICMIQVHLNTLCNVKPEAHMSLYRSLGKEDFIAYRSIYINFDLPGLESNRPRPSLVQNWIFISQCCFMPNTTAFPLLMAILNVEQARLSNVKRDQPNPKFASNWHFTIFFYWFFGQTFYF